MDRLVDSVDLDLSATDGSSQHLSEKVSQLCLHPKNNHEIRTHEGSLPKVSNGDSLLEMRIMSNAPPLSNESCRNLLPIFQVAVEGERKGRDLYIEMTMAATQPNTYVEFCVKMSPILEIGEFMESRVSIPPPQNIIFGKDRAFKKDYVRTAQIVKPLDEDGTASFSSILPHVLTREIDPNARFFLVFSLYERHQDGNCTRIVTERTSSFTVHSKRDTKRRSSKTDKPSVQKRKLQFDFGSMSTTPPLFHPSWSSLVPGRVQNGTHPGISSQKSTSGYAASTSSTPGTFDVDFHASGHCPSEIVLSETSEVLSVASMESVDNISRGGDSTVDSIDTLSRGDERPDDLFSRGGDDTISRSESVDQNIDGDDTSVSGASFDSVPQSLLLHRCILLTVDSYIDNLSMLQNYADDLFGKISRVHNHSDIGLDFLRSLWASLDVSFLPPELLQRIYSRIACFSLLFLQNLFPNPGDCPVSSEITRYPSIVTTIVCMDPDLYNMMASKQLQSALRFNDLNLAVLRSLAERSILSVRRSEHILGILKHIPFVALGSADGV